MEAVTMTISRSLVWAALQQRPEHRAPPWAPGLLVSLTTFGNLLTPSVSNKH